MISTVTWLAIGTYWMLLGVNLYRASEETPEFWQRVFQQVLVTGVFSLAWAALLWGVRGGIEWIGG